jgi:hypothetical protein
VLRRTNPRPRLAWSNRALLAARAGNALTDRAKVREQQRFGGLAVMVDGNMAVGVVGERLMVRLDGAGAAAALDEPHVAPMDFTGRPTPTMVSGSHAPAADARRRLSVVDDWRGVPAPEARRELPR